MFCRLLVNPLHALSPTGVAAWTKSTGMAVCKVMQTMSTTDGWLQQGCSLLDRSPGKVEGPLRLLLVGHNPSAHAWSSGHYYSNPSNRMWPLLTSSGIVPSHFTSVNDDDCPWACGVGFTDLVSIVTRLPEAHKRMPALSFLASAHFIICRPPLGAGNRQPWHQKLWLLRRCAAVVAR